MVAGWLAGGMLLTEQVVTNGRGLLARYGVIQKIEPVLSQAKEIAVSNGTFLYIP
jgi:hypothetical protein